MGKRPSQKQRETRFKKGHTRSRKDVSEEQSEQTVEGEAHGTTVKRLKRGGAEHVDNVTSQTAAACGSNSQSLPHKLGPRAETEMEHQASSAVPQVPAGQSPAMEHVTGYSNVDKDMPEDVKKCAKFLSMLIELAANQPDGTVSIVRALIQGLIDGNLEPELFTVKLVQELKSAPQPLLLPRLKKTLPLLRQSLLSNKMSIDGVRPPPVEVLQQMPPNVLQVVHTTVPNQVQHDSKASMEVCVDCVASACNAESGGAVRVELCANLMEGGTTPSIGMLKILKRRVSIPVYVMIRPRGGDFLYTNDEFDVMCEDVRELKAAGADGFVFGILKEDGAIDQRRCKILLDLVSPKEATFHRAIDVSHDISEALEVVIKLGFQRVLTSGGDSTVLEGLPTIRNLQQQANGRIVVMPGGGITERNLARILSQSQVSEFHCSARSSLPSGMMYKKEGVPMGASLTPPEYGTKVTDTDKVKRLVSMATVPLEDH